MSKNPSQALIPAGVIEHRIYLLRNHKVMLDRDLAHLYGVDTRILNQAVKRNRERFPEDFMFQLSSKETRNLRSQIVTSRWGGRRYLPYAFTEQGVAMLSSVLKSNERSAAAVAKIANGLLGQGFGHDDIVILTLRGSAESIFSDRERVGPYVLRRFTQGYDLFGNQLMTPGTVRLELVVKADNPLNQLLLSHW